MWRQSITERIRRGVKNSQNDRVSLANCRAIYIGVLLPTSAIGRKNATLLIAGRQSPIVW